MSHTKQQKKAIDFYNKHYTPVFVSDLLSGNAIQLADHANDEVRMCRFCGLGEPDVTFRKIAHAIPEFLGNKIITSQNECDSCNKKLADEYEDHLAKWFGPLRAVSQIKGKNGVPTYASKDIRIEGSDQGLKMGIVTEDIESLLKSEGPFVFKVPVPTPAQQYVPIRAAKALLKTVCSICPADLLIEVQPTIDWLMSRRNARMSMFPVLFAFTPGPNPYADGKVLLLRRKSDADLPYIWCVLATANYRFQFFVPFCPKDKWMAPGKDLNITMRNFPDLFGDTWPHGKTKFSILDWSGEEPVVREQSLSFHVESAEEVEIGAEKDPEDF